MANSGERHSVFKRMADWVMRVWQYCSRGVWNDTRQGLWVNVVKTLNLSVNSFLNTDLQSRAAALTYRTILAVVPAMALLFAIGRGFGFQNILHSQLVNALPIDKSTLDMVIVFVDSYLAYSSEGIFVGVGIVFLLWTLISLVGNVEDAFNAVWGIRRGRTIWRKVADYTAIFLILPILMICASGLQIFMSESLQNVISFEFLSPVYPVLLDIATYVLTWLFFAGMYMLVPYTKVKFKNAFMSGVISGTAFHLLQWLFVSGQLYVSKYNAIYGGFAFLPLLLMWIYLVWTITLSGAVLCYSSQNIFRFSYFNDIKDISPGYRRKISVAIMALIARQFRCQRPPLTINDLTVSYQLPIRLVTQIVNDFIEAGLVSRVLVSDDDEYGLQPAIDVNSLTLGYMLRKIDSSGSSDFVKGIDNDFSMVYNVDNEIFGEFSGRADSVLLSELQIKLKS